MWTAPEKNFSASLRFSQPRKGQPINNLVSCYFWKDFMGFIETYFLLIIFTGLKPGTYEIFFIWYGHVKFSIPDSSAHDDHKFISLLFMLLMPRKLPKNSFH